MLTRRGVLGRTLGLAGIAAAGAATAAGAGAAVLGTARSAGARGEPLVGPVADDALHVMTYNLRAPQPGTAPGEADHWPDRAPLAGRLLAAEHPHLVGLQEVCEPHLDVVADALPGHRLLGLDFGPDTLAGRPVLAYDTDRFDLLDVEQHALSETPEEPTTHGWGAMFPRSVLLARLADRTTGRELLAVDTHFDHRSEFARVQSATMIRDGLAEVDVPVVLLGDLNVPVDASLPAAVLAGAGLRDAWVAAARRRTPEWGTFPSYGEPEEGGRRIDGVLVSARVAVLAAAVNATSYDGAWPSDHLPVQAVLRLA